MLFTYFFASVLHYLGVMNHWELKAPARRADRARGEERRWLVDRLTREIPKLDPFEGHDEFTVWFAKSISASKIGTDLPL